VKKGKKVKKVNEQKLTFLQKISLVVILSFVLFMLAEFINSFRKEKKKVNEPEFQPATFKAKEGSETVRPRRKPKVIMTKKS
jgi:large-conductance mechanosensitive channel